MDGNSDNIFFLGGHDLEMMTIRDLLVSKDLRYGDLDLKWNNAKLSAYKVYVDKFLSESFGGMIYGVELENDLDLPAEVYVPIDHHNVLSHNPSALEQVVELLQVEMTREYELIAANDKYYIPGMLAIGASEEEIQNIRLRDRAAQGVTLEDERLAERAIRDNLSVKNGLVTVKAYNSVFSPICDRLYPYNSLLIYSSTEFTYYGAAAVVVLHLLNDEYDKGGVFYGGGEKGYVGSKKGFYLESEINELVKRIKDGIA